MNNEKIAQVLGKYGWKKIAVAVVVVILALNVFVTLVNGKYNSLKAEVDQIKATSAAVAPTDELAQLKGKFEALKAELQSVSTSVEELAQLKGEFEALKAELQSVSTSVEELKKANVALVKANYDLFKAQAEAMGALAKE